VASKKRKRAGRKQPAPSGGPYRASKATGAPEPWRWGHFAFGVFFLGCALVFYFIVDWTEQGGRSETFATWFLGGLVALGLGMVIYGIKRWRDPSPAPSRLDELYPPLFFLGTWQRIDEEARIERLERRKAGAGYDWRPLIVLCFGAVFLTLMEFWGDSRTFHDVLAWAHGDADEPTFWSGLQSGPFRKLNGHAWWAGWRVLGYFVLPCLVTWTIMRGRIRDYGLSTKGFREHAWIYAFAFLIVFVLVVIVSYTDSFSTYYPFYRQRLNDADPAGAHRSWFDFGTWELLYAAQFFSLEFFFRGWWLEACKRTMGSHAIFAMVVPYCMIHYGKPLPETLVAIIAGVFLGTLAMKTRSIWSGFLIHCSVAISMDVAAILQTEGHLPTQWWPT